MNNLEVYLRSNYFHLISSFSLYLSFSFCISLSSARYCIKDLIVLELQACSTKPGRTLKCLKISDK
ncbi:hypothetical protein LEMLEM_LOCUS15371, partial [Lemmus lemmus]